MQNKNNSQMKKIIKGRMNLEILTSEQWCQIETMGHHKTCCKCNQKLLIYKDFPIMVWHENSILPIWRAFCFSCEKKIKRDRDIARKNAGKPNLNHRCPICNLNSDDILNKYPKKRIKKDPFMSCWSCDHDHETGDFRGFICQECNRALGMFNDDVKMLKNAINYLSGDTND